MTASSLEQRCGLFYSVVGNTLLVASDVRGIAEQRAAAGVASELDPQFIRDFAAASLGDRATPLKDVHRLPPGTALSFVPGRGVRVTRSPLPGALPEPSLSGDRARRTYLEAFDGAVDALCDQSEPSVAMVSGGLDSTFMVASLVRHATPERPVHALVHVPSPEAGCQPIGNRDPDEEHLVRAMADAYPDLIQVVPFVTGGAGLDAAAETCGRAWWPVLNPSNQVWLNAMIDHARALGSESVFTGSMGNFTFSHRHDYSLADAVRGGRAAEAAAIVRADRAAGLAWRRIAQDARGLRAESATAYRQSLGIPDERPDRALAGSGRDQWLALMLSVGRPYASWATPRAMRGLKLKDPFAAESVVRAAAAVSEPEWHRGPAPRAFARVLGQGRVPDAIRLRTRRGVQAADAWWHIRNQRDRYFDEWSALQSSPGLGGWIDPRPIRERIESWPWGEPDGPPLAEIIGVDRVLSLAAFARMLAEGLASLPVR